MKIAIRADGGQKIGMGHIMRCMALAKELKNYDFDIVFLTKKDEKVIEMIETNGFKYINISSNSLEEELIEVESIVNEERVEIIITDSYWLSDNYLHKLRKLVKLLISIDDNNLYKYPSHIVINGNVYAEDLKYKKIFDNTKFLLGGNYTLLREEFRNVSPVNINKEVRNILITMGGVDINNYTPFILDSLKNLDVKLNVIVGPGFKCIRELKCIANKNNNVNLIYNPTNMKDIMVENDIAISAAGSTTYELAVLGIPTILIVQADNQIKIAEKMSELNGMVNLGWFEDIKGIQLLDSVNYLIKNYSLRKYFNNKLSKLISSFGVENIRIHIGEYVKKCIG
ncbi:UDP-2,4-diacetamido-2,4,6-trideoxy-beta-L-altropyranose hydrolase [Tepidibacter thalassicus]|uniref:UDP-2,4-diacetamido-2,4,6-trideoxy-beta-L-altropyranose hydrolase n=1 Tax=Tepidibacter thalassicus DSM 15285 TaxID=1123350 RepID=A0A1M5R3W3_9FIRM|nr:UDP-2,4-diacetamido-2,4,6-trideoxy-beta-L-altropyranose hydrolase [Tepidibacter thalassicus]SHH20848.1 UDP-2,4-diacetamido-2,4,6-trideoxy-beta-L-altropyranose hydrolase [Tepidibacter thalassicus DSM 15285]